MGGMQYDIPVLLRNVARYLGVDVKIDNSETVGKNVAFIESQFDENRPVISLLSRKYLTYMNENFRDDILHVINIIDYDAEEEKFHIVDSYIPTNPVRVYSGEPSIYDYERSLLSAKDMFQQRLGIRSVSFGQPVELAKRLQEKRIL